MKPPSELLLIIFQFLQKLFNVFYDLIFKFLLTTGGVQVHEFDDGLIGALRVFTPFLQGADEAIFLVLQAESASCTGTFDNGVEFGHFFQCTEGVLDPHPLFYGDIEEILSPSMSCNDLLKRQ